MPISGVVISSIPERTWRVMKRLQQLESVDIFGHDRAGNVVAVLDTTTSEEMEKVIALITGSEDVLNVGMTYLNAEDEAAQLARGESLARPFGFKLASDEGS